MKCYAYEYPITKDGTLNIDKDNILCYQLVFATWPSPASARSVPYNNSKDSEDQVVKRFEKKYNVSCKWVSIGYGKLNHLGYKITEKDSHNRES